MKIRNDFILKNQSGAALVVALIMMVVLTLIGLASIFSSTFEVKISGNKRCSTNAFYGADSGIQVVLARVENFNPNSYDSGTLKYSPFTDTNNINPTNAKVTNTFVSTQQGAPRGYGFSAINFEFEHFMVESTAYSCPVPAASASTVQDKVVRLVPTLQGGY
jgi:Tfp pilus assembly protein PilX